MNEIVLTAEDANFLRHELTKEQTERCAILFANYVERKDGKIRLLVREVNLPEPFDYNFRSEDGAELKPEFVSKITKYAARKSLSIVFVHSHPGTTPPYFSTTDSIGEKLLSNFLSHRHPNCLHAAMVISKGGMRARFIGTNKDICIISIGNDREVIFDPSARTHQRIDNGVYDRQVRAFGSQGQQVLQRLRIAIVGLGGTGSIVAQQLVHLGVQDFVLIDPDILEYTNLNRVANARPADVGRPKVQIAADYIRSINPDSAICCVEGDIVQNKSAETLLEADFIFGCTDSHGSRAVLQQVAYQYLIPCIDMGSTINVSQGSVSHVYGRVQLLSPGLACFSCSNLLDGNEVRRDMMTHFERKSDPYIQGVREPAPAVISLNGTIASIAITMFLSVVTGIPITARHVLYNGLRSLLKSVHVKPDPTCYICSKSGSLAHGRAWPLLGRKD